MIETSDKANGWVIRGVEIRSDDDAQEGEWCAYKIRIETDRGVIRFEGCHDLTPDIDIKPDVPVEVDGCDRCHAHIRDGVTMFVPCHEHGGKSAHKGVIEIQTGEGEQT